jgi:hypothetical protein
MERNLVKQVPLLQMGCADASVRIYDRRMLSTRLTGSSDPINSGKNVPSESSCDSRPTFTRTMNTDEFKENQNYPQLVIGRHSLFSLIRLCVSQHLRLTSMLLLIRWLS